MLSSPISFANNCFAVDNGLLIHSDIASSVDTCSINVCGDLLHSTCADFVISDASFLRSA